MRYARAAVIAANNQRGLGRVIVEGTLKPLESITILLNTGVYSI